ncbi:MAG: hypothetical protein J7L23_05465 [Candidatus Diapherotrites archaeon]|nr:hypothetical protein [Candidatus Diapherotrites archaeon]
MTNKGLKIILSMVLLCSLALAIPGIPHQFYGSVTVNGAPAPDGTVVTAKINGVEVASGTTIGGKYGQNPNVFYIPDADGNRAGKTISFFVAGKDTGVTTVFANGGSTKLDFSVTVATNNGGNTGSSTGSTSHTGGGSYGGGAVIDITQEIANYQVGDLNITRSYYYDGNNVVMKLVYENTGNETLYNVDVTDTLDSPFGEQIAFFHKIAPGEKKYDEYELGKWASLYQMNGIIKEASAPTITIGQVGETEASPAPEPTKPESKPRDEGVIPPKPEVSQPAAGANSQSTGLFALGIGSVIIGAVVLAAIVAALLFFYTKKKGKKSKAKL